MAELPPSEVRYSPESHSPEGGSFVAPAVKRFDWKRFVVVCGAIVVIAACGIGMLAFLGFGYGPVPTLIGLAAAILPVPVLVSAFLWLDRYEPEPWKYLIFCFGWGSCVATALALAVNTGASVAFNVAGASDSHVATLVAPFIEELGKAIGPALLFFFRRKAFSGPVDGIVYFGLSAVGFAMMENILYMGRVYIQGSDQSGLASVGVLSVFMLFIVRVVLSGFAHPLFTSMTGIAFGYAARNASKGARTFLPLCGLMLAMMLHGSWNLIATLAQFEGLVILYGYFAFMMPVFFGVVGFALWLRAQDGRIAGRVLPVYVKAAWMSPPEVASLVTLGRRLTARYWARQFAGPEGARAMSGYQATATKLALLRDAAERGIVPADFAAEELRLLHELAGYRAVFTGRDPRTPQGMWTGSVYRLVFPDRSVREVAAPESPVVPMPLAPPPPPPPMPYGYGYGYGGPRG
ncbi:PrsW family intramembrane metalloprotease [Longispora albida]|uniref:PrsW family intramembrane metalloprotease n=1 Tax=Longispora albida TaxID=203523 RepID=UPI0009FC55F2|nr:PrsW family intramembrane metalloprotease [Longispora albida]